MRHIQVIVWPGSHSIQRLINLPHCHFYVLSADDGSLSLEEFQTFFADGVLSSKELEELFRQIDTHKTK